MPSLPPPLRLLLGMRRGPVRGKRRSIVLARHSAGGVTQIPAVENQVQLLPTAALAGC